MVGRLPWDLPAALFVVLHIPAQSPSLLPEILGRVSKMPVREVVEGMRVERDHVYVIPPGTVMALVRAAFNSTGLFNPGKVLPEPGMADQRVAIPVGVMAKAAKPHQERRVDLPVIGVRTVELVAEAGLSGIAVEGGAALIMGRARVVEAADRYGIFVYGFAPGDDKGE